MNKLKIKSNTHKLPLKSRLGIGGFTLIEMAIVSGLMGLMGVYMMQMTSNMNKTMTKMDTRAAEQNLLYLSTLALTNRAACGKTLGNFCYDPDTSDPVSKNFKRLPGNIIYITQPSCEDEGGVWADDVNNITVREWPSGTEFKTSNVGMANSRIILHDIASATSSGSGGTISWSGAVFNSNYGSVFKSCNQWTTASESTPADCVDEEFYVDRKLMLKQFFLANYPEDDGGVPLGGGVGKVKFVFEYARLKENNKVMRKGIDLYVQTDTNNRIESCLSANDVEVFAQDATYIVQADATNLTNGQPSTCSVSCGTNDDGELDQMVAYDAFKSSGMDNNLIGCDMNLTQPTRAGGGDAVCSYCDESRGEVDQNAGDPNDRCDAECKEEGPRYTSVTCHYNGGDPGRRMSGCRGVCVKRF